MSKGIEVADQLDLSELPPGPPVSHILPMQAPARIERPFSSPDWLYEVKYDGWRCLAQVDQGAVELRTKTGVNCSTWFPEVCEAFKSLPGGPYVFDAEACVLDELGRSDFHRMQARAVRRKYVPGVPVTLCVFDLLVESGRSLMGLPLVVRKERLKALLARMPQRSILYVGDLPAQEELFWTTVPQLKLEGFMAKRLLSPYTQGARSPDWKKIKPKGAIEPQRFRRLRKT